MEATATALLEGGQVPARLFERATHACLNVPQPPVQTRHARVLERATPSPVRTCHSLAYSNVPHPPIQMCPARPFKNFDQFLTSG